jgi:hypothetical protein
MMYNTPDATERNHPANADILLAARDDSSRYYFVKRRGSGVVSIPATNSRLARELAADEYPSHTAEDFHEISGEERRMIRRWRRRDRDSGSQQQEGDGR